MKALIYTSDPWEPSGVIGLFETEEQKQNILEAFLTTECYNTIGDVKEIEIPIGIFDFYW